MGNIFRPLQIIPIPRKLLLKEKNFQKSLYNGKKITELLCFYFLKEKNFPNQSQEIIFGSSDSTISKRISQLEKEGKIRKLAPKVYTSNLEDEPEKIVLRNLFSILGHLYPGALRGD